MFSRTIGPLTHSKKTWICRSCLQNIGPVAAAHFTTTTRQRQHAGNMEPPSMEQIRAQYNKKNTTILYGGNGSGVMNCSDLRQILCFKPDSRNCCPVIRLSSTVQDGRIALNKVLVQTLIFVSRYVSRWAGVASPSSRQAISLVIETLQNV